jgi:hypothetical protein
MVAVPVVSMGEPGRTSIELKATLVIDMVQLMAAAAGDAMPQTARAGAAMKIRSCRIAPNAVFGERTILAKRSTVAEGTCRERYLEF